MFENILQRKKPFPDNNNHKIKSRNIAIFPKGLRSMLLVNNWQFFHLFIIGKIAQHSVFESILEKKKPFPDYKNKELKKSKIWHFSKEVTKWFQSKIGNFFIFSI